MAVGSIGCLLHSWDFMVYFLTRSYSCARRSYSLILHSIFWVDFHIYYTHFITNVWEHISPSPYPQYILLCILFRTWNFITYLNNFYFVIKIDFVNKIEVLLICHGVIVVILFIALSQNLLQIFLLGIFLYLQHESWMIFLLCVIIFWFCVFFLMYLAPPPKLLEVEPRVLYASIVFVQNFNLY